MMNDEEFDFIASKYFSKIRRIGFDLPETADADIPSKVEEMNEILERIKEVRTIQRGQRGEERPRREDNEQILGKVKQYRLELPPRIAFERMKLDLRDWIKRNEIGEIQIYIHTEPDGRRGVRFIDRSNGGDNQLLIIGWPANGLVDGAIYTPDELLITGEAGKA